MKGRKVITVLIIINLILVGIIYNLINRINVNNKKQIIKEMTEIEYENYITELNISHTDYANYIDESKAKIASAITDMGVETSNQETLEIMAENIRTISVSEPVIVKISSGSGEGSGANVGMCSFDLDQDHKFSKLKILSRGGYVGYNAIYVGNSIKTENITVGQEFDIKGAAISVIAYCSSGSSYGRANITIELS